MTQTVLLGDIAKIKGGKRLPKGEVLQDVKNSHPYLRIVDMGEKFIKKPSLQYVPDDVFPKISRYITNTNDVLISIVGTIGLVAIVDSELDNASLTENCVKLTCDTDKIDPQFLYYFLSSATGQDEIRAGRVGSTQPKLPLYNIAKIRVPNLSLETQKKIVNILGTIDEKIELNRQMNETLEQMGQALFRHYFIDNPEADKWEDGIVSDLITIYSGYAFKRTDFDPDGKYGLVTIKNVQDGNFMSECSDHLSDIPAKTPDYAFLKTGDILLSLTGNVGRVCIVHGENLLLNQRVAKLVGADGKQSFAYFMFRQEEFKNKLISMSRGTAQLNLSPIETKKLKMKLPPKELLSQYHEQAEPLFEAITANYTEIQTLTTLRDTLLPRLISGKVKV